MSRTRIKFCGLTRPEDAVCAAELGADSIGLVFYPPSGRAVTVEQARAVVAVLPAFVTVTALFLDADRDEVERVVESVAVDLLQFHGSESPAFCESFGRPYIKALPMADSIDVDALARDYGHARALLLDSHARGQAGGRGESFDWRRISLSRPVVLAGGLAPDNVAEAIKTMRPWAVDVSSGVESSPGIKDPERMAAFVDEVNRAG